MFKLHAKDALVEQNDHPAHTPQERANTHNRPGTKKKDKETGKMEVSEKRHGREPSGKADTAKDIKR